MSPRYCVILREDFECAVRALKEIAEGKARCQHTRESPLRHAQPEIGVRMMVHNPECPTRIARKALRALKSWTIV